MQYDIMK